MERPTTETRRSQWVSTQVEITAPQLPFLPPPESVPVPFVTFGANGMPQPALLPLNKATEILAPPLTMDEEILALSVLDLANDLSGLDVKGLYLDPFETVRSLVSGAGLDGALFGSDQLLSLELQGEDRARAEAFVTEILNQLSERYTSRLTGVV